MEWGKEPSAEITMASSPHLAVQVFRMWPPF